MSSGTGPRVMGVIRHGVHLQPTTLVVQLSEPLDPSGAEDLGNYRLTFWGRNRSLKLASAVYDASAETVTLHPLHRLPLRLVYRLVIQGSSPSAIKGASGILLDGIGKGRPGTSSVLRITARRLVLPSHLTGPR